jgi:hypothetical protein
MRQAFAGERSSMSTTQSFVPLTHRPETVAPDAATDIEKHLAAPILGLQMDRPPAELLFLFGLGLGTGIPPAPQGTVASCDCLGRPGRTVRNRPFGGREARISRMLTKKHYR